MRALHPKGEEPRMNTNRHECLWLGGPRCSTKYNPRKSVQSSKRFRESPASLQKAPHPSAPICSFPIRIHSWFWLGGQKFSFTNGGSNFIL